MHHTTGCNPLQQIHQIGLEPGAIMASNFEMLCFLALVYLWAIHLNIYPPGTPENQKYCLAGGSIVALPSVLG